jgi:hypothetical protein
MASDQSKTSRPVWYKRQLIVNPKVQRAFILYGMAMGLVFFMAGGVTVALLQRFNLIQVQGWDPVSAVDGILALVLMVLMTAGFYLGVIASNHVVGPLHRLLTEMRNYHAQGEIRKLIFRKEDYFHEVAEAYNDVIERTRASRQ